MHVRHLASTQSTAHGPKVRRTIPLSTTARLSWQTLSVSDSVTVSVSVSVSDSVSDSDSDSDSDADTDSDSD
ncbi:MAG: hypothetical protein OXT09_01715, partial [Myxococcales bacterium]|nr:hypothetical protein [Myxococcales bacterium]